MGKNLRTNNGLLILSVSILASMLLSIPISGALASDNSGPGRGDDDDQAINSIPLTVQNPSGPVTSITIPLDAESHGAANPYVPNPATVNSGSTVTWINTDDEDQHTATADDGSFSTGLINPGSSGSAVINAMAGTTVAYHCDVHPEMRGTLQISASTNGQASNATVAQSPDLNSTMLQIASPPFAVGNYTTGEESPLGNDTIQASVMGSTAITLPNSSETITTNDTGTVTITFKAGGAILNAQLNLKTEDGLDNATITATEFFSSENAPGRGIAFFSTNSTGKLAALNGVVALTLDESQSDGSAKVSFFEWRAMPSQTNAPGNVTSGNTTTTTGPVRGQGSGSVQVSITPGSSTKTQNAFDPNPVQVSTGDTVTWINDDSTPHTVTSGANGQPDGRFDSSPNFNPLLAPGQEFSHVFLEGGEYPYYCGLHPNMVGTVNVS